MDKAFLQGLRQVTTPVGVDTETTGLEVSSNRDYLQGFSVAYRLGGMLLSEYFPVRHETDNMDRADIMEVLDVLAGKTLVFFNRKFDLHSFMTMGVDFSSVRAYDTMLLAHMINENKPYAKSLDNCGQLYLKKGKVDKDEMGKLSTAFGWGSIPPSTMSPYARGDAELTLELYEKLITLFNKMFGDKAEELWLNEFKFQNILFKMESRGIKVDLKFCADMQGIAELEMGTIEYELDFAPSKTTALAKFLFEELKLPVLAYTPGMKPSMAKDVMEEYDRMLEQHDDDRARQVLNYRGWQKASSTFFKPFQKLVDSNGRVHCSYKQHGTTTGRLSCSDPNVQQIPRSSDKRWNGRIKEAFLPTEGYSKVSLDYSQLEFRLGAAYGNETLLIEEFSKDDADPFTILAEEIGVDRYTAKTMTYGLLYGAGLQKIAKLLNRPVSEVEGPYKKFLASIPGIIRVKKMCEAKAAYKGYINYWDGRQRHFPIRDDSYKAFNSLLQGGAASIVKHVMIEIDESICDENCYMLLQVHDELIFEIKTEFVEEYTTRIIKAMEAFPTETFGVNFKVAGK